jgi:nucleoside phosphorylase
MAATEADVAQLYPMLGVDPGAGRRLYLSRVYPDCSAAPGVALAGPLIGAPQAAMVLETLIAWGAQRLVFMGWCGTLTAEAGVGDIVIPASAWIDEGTSRHYLPGRRVCTPSESLARTLSDLLRRSGPDAHRGRVWTTDAVFRETPGKVVNRRQRGAMAVDMETSALFSVARYRGVDLAAVLAVSDDLSTLRWRPGFKDPRFVRGRERACEAIGRFCRDAGKSRNGRGTMEGPHP